MLGVESKPSDNDRFKTESSHEKALDKLGYRGLFGSGLGAGLGPVFGTSLGANLSASLSTSFGPPHMGTSYHGNSDVVSGREGLIPHHSVHSVERIRPGDLGRGALNGPTCRPLPTSTATEVSCGGIPPGGPRKESPGVAVELVKPSLVYDVASLILYRCQALPIKLKIALDRLFSVLTHDDVLQVLHGFGWTYDDYSRGYMLQDQNGSVLHKWNMVTPEEESILLQQFLRFGETKNIVQQLLTQQDNSRLDRVARDVREARDLRDSRERDGRESRDFREVRDRDARSRRDHHRERREHRDLNTHLNRDQTRDFREKRDDYNRSDEVNKSFLHPHHPHQKHLGGLSQQPPFPLPLQFGDPTKPLDPEQLKKLLERNMLFNPFMRGSSGDPNSLLRPPHPTAPHSIPPTSPFSNLLSVNPSLASSLLANPHLASSLSMLRLPVPPVSLPNMSPSNGSLPASFGGPTSPMGGSPLNRLQSMQPFDYRKERKSPSPPKSSVSDVPMVSTGGRPSSTAAATSPNSILSGGSAGGIGVGGVSPSSNVTQMGLSNQLHSDSVSLQERIDHFSEDEDSSSTSSAALNLSTTTTTDSPMGTGAGNGNMSLTSKDFVPSSGGPPTPPKRSWNPINMGTSLINPVTGKKRVQCNVCLKTFCDKGALKIHFSAVHLREMHKCTVEGCNMMFSSRRSRNRHSANPNPKLHTPHVRRKISPHDGRTASSHPVMLPHAFPQQLSQSLQPPAGFPPLGGFPGQFGGINPLTGLPLIPHSSASSSDLHKQAMELQRQNLELHGLGKDLSLRGDENIWKYGPPNSSSVSGLEDYSDISRSYNGGENKKQRYDQGSFSVDEEEDSMSTDANSFKGDGALASPSANKRKRKSQNPTKFAFRLEDDDLICTDDDEDDDNEELDDIDEKDSDEDKNEDKELDAMSDEDEDENIPIDRKNSAGKDRTSNKRHHESSSEEFENSNRQSEMSSALRHLEDLSKGKFNVSNEMPACDSENRDSLGNNSTSELTPSSPKANEKENDRDSEVDFPTEELENTLQYFDGGFLSNVDVPMDKENPRKCVSCGKIFQNHFGVKIHYQNVHLKLLHKCTVEGCNAAFPSKRSRDRHASNLSLHKKLLSTADNNLSGFPSSGFPNFNFNSSINPEILARIYSDPASFSLDALKAQLPTSLANSLFSSSTSKGIIGSQLPMQTPNPSSSPFFLHNLLPHLTSNNNIKKWGKSRTPSPKSSVSNDISGYSNSLSATNLLSPQPMEEDNHQNERLSSARTPTNDNMNHSPSMSIHGSKSPSSDNQDVKMEVGGSTWIYNLEEDLPSPDRDGNMPCRFCYQTFEDGEALKNHYESLHRKDLFKCPVEGCHKYFSSRRKRNNHELNQHRSVDQEQSAEN